MPTHEIICGDALVEMPKLIERGVKVDASLTDPPYGTTACAWDSVIPFAPMWASLKALVKKNGAIVLFGSQPFTSALVMSNPGMFKYQWTWNKANPTGFLNAKKQPLRVVDEIVVFYDEQPTFNPQMVSTGIVRRKGGGSELTANYGKFVRGYFSEDDLLYPKNLIEYSNANHAESVHPTQKPVELMRYLVRTYTNPGDTVLDFTMGSGSTGVACVIEGRNFIGIEQDAHYCEVAEARIKRAQGVPCDIPKVVKADRPAPLFEGAAL